MPEIDPTLSLALSIHSNNGVYAVLLGSGVSSSSGIPTGWAIVQNLIQKLAHLKGEDCGSEPEAWYRTVFDREPDYSDLLNEVTKSSAERSQLLRGYFEPTQDELEQRLKQPTPAHRAIARLVARGYVKVILTTNFDRLLEQALSDEGVQPSVISTAHGAKGALPLAHSPCTVVKINGDYLDSRLRNTRDELSEYERPIRQILNQILDEYGLVICGWSGEWDTALRAAMERCSTHRFPTYWTTRRPISSKAQNLVTLRRATVLKIQSADVFFASLDDKVNALEEFGALDPVSPTVAVAQMKRYLANDADRIRLHDFVSAEVERVYKAIRGNRFPVNTSPGTVAGETLEARLRAYESELSVLLPVMICGAFWGRDRHYLVLLQALKRMGTQDGREGGVGVWVGLRRYPALILLYGMALAALAGNNYQFLRQLVTSKIRTRFDQPEEPVALAVHHMNALKLEIQKTLPSHKDRLTPLSDHLFGVLRESVREYLPDEQDYDRTFDWLEYFLGLVYCDLKETRSTLKKKVDENPTFSLWGPVGRFAWKESYGAQTIMQETDTQEDGRRPERVASVLSTGFFESGGQHDDKFKAVKAGFDRHIRLVRNNWGLFF